MREVFLINDDIAYNDFKQCLDEGLKILSIKNNVIHTKEYSVEVYSEYSDLLQQSTIKTMLDFEEHDTLIVENQGYKFITFKGD